MSSGGCRGGHLRRKPEQPADGPLHLHRVAFALAQHDDPRLPVEEVEARPGPVAPRTPGPVAVVLADGIADPELADGMLHIRAQMLEGEFRRVDADELQAGRRVLLVPALQVGQRAQDVDAGVGPEVHDADLAPQRRGVERRRGVQPFLDQEWWCARSSGLGRLRARARRGGAVRQARCQKVSTLHGEPPPELAARAQAFSSPASTGRVRIRRPVAAKIAFATAGPTAQVGASPMPPGASPLLTRCVSTAGTSSIRIGR